MVYMDFTVINDFIFSGQYKLVFSKTYTSDI
jgi:hypothetical protein